MIDMSETLLPDSKQLNADDLLGGKSITIKITDVTAKEDKKQPRAIHYEGDGGKPWIPCKTMRRILGQLWGMDGKKYIGRSLTLYRDAEVIFGGMKVGGIRISHMSNISEEVSMALTQNNKGKKMHIVKPLVVENLPNADDMIKSVEAAQSLDDLKTVFSSAQKMFKNSTEFARIHEAKEKRKLELTPAVETKTE